ncbi:MAG: tellurite resistance TerB family protein [Pirellulales bacterium]
MGLFDSLFGGFEGGGKLTPQEAFAGILMGASGCDGHIGDEEVQALATALLRMKLYQRINEKQFGQILNKVHGILKKKGASFLVEGCAAGLPKELRNAAFTNAVDIVLADGVVEDDEKAFIELLAGKLEIDGTTARTIAEIMVVKNRG